MEQASASAAAQTVKRRIFRAKPAKSKQGHFRRFGAFYIMMAPSIIFLLINNYIPMVGSLIAFKNIKFAPGETLFESFLRSPWVGMFNFEFLFKTSDAWLITRNTVQRSEMVAAHPAARQHLEGNRLLRDHLHGGDHRYRRRIL
jgi:putative aldouronate transport system permease protein